MNHRQKLLTAVAKYCESTQRARSGVGLTILNDSKFFDRIENGASCTVDTYEKVMCWLKQHTPRKGKEQKSGGG